MLVTKMIGRQRNYILVTIMIGRQRNYMLVIIMFGRQLNYILVLIMIERQLYLFLGGNEIIHWKLLLGGNIIIIINNYVQPRGSFAHPVVWRAGTALDLASHWPGTRDEPLSMREECAICGRGAEFPRASGQRLPDFSSSVFIALTGFTSRSFPLSGPM